MTETKLKLTERSQKVIELALREGLLFKSQCAGTEHLLLGLSKEGAGVGSQVLKAHGIQFQRLKAEIERIHPINHMKEYDLTVIELAPSVMRILDLAEKNAKHLRHSYVGTEHILIGILDSTDTLSSCVLKNMGLSFEEIRKDLFGILGKRDPQIDISDERDKYRIWLDEAMDIAYHKGTDIASAFTQVAVRNIKNG